MFYNGKKSKQTKFWEDKDQGGKLTGKMCQGKGKRRKEKEKGKCLLNTIFAFEKWEGF